MDKLWALYILELESLSFTEGVGLPIPLDLADEVVKAARVIAEAEYSFVPSVAAAINRTKGA